MKLSSELMFEPNVFFPSSLVPLPPTWKVLEAHPSQPGLESPGAPLWTRCGSEGSKVYKERKSYLISLPLTSSPHRYDSLMAPVARCHRPQNYPKFSRSRRGEGSRGHKENLNCLGNLAELDVDKNHKSTSSIRIFRVSLNCDGRFCLHLSTSGSFCPQRQSLSIIE